MALNIQQVQRQTQRLIMTPQMQQSIQLLQMNSLELEQLAQQELLTNPFLTLEDETPDATPEPPEDTSTPTAVGEPEPDALEPTPVEPFEGTPDAADLDTNTAAPDPTAAAPTAEPTDADAPAAGPSEGDESDAAEWDAPLPIDEAPAHFDEVDLDWDNYYDDADNPVYFGGDRETYEEHDLADYVAARTSLAETLERQLRCSALDGIDVEIAEYLIGCLNDDGYLPPEAVDEAAERFAVPREQVERVLAVVQEFDPPGIAARSLAECLLIQLRAQGQATDLARTVLEEHMEEFFKKRHRELARKLKVPEEQLAQLYQRISRLEPHPGRSLTTESVQYIQPDVVVKLVDGEMLIYLNEGVSRRLSVNRFYRRLMRQQREALTAQEREFAREKYRAALNLIKNIEKRKSTILYVTQAIMEVQREFLEKGIAALKPLTLREVAERVGMHESTVARVTSRKYVETPQGVFPLKFFFSSSIESENGREAVSSRAIKAKLQRLIEEEDPRRPLSDQKIAELLQREGFSIARRTVAKYREQLKILPAKYRRKT